MEYTYSQIEIVKGNTFTNLQRSINTVCAGLAVEDKKVVGIQYPDAWQYNTDLPESPYIAVVSYLVKNGKE